MPVINNIKKIRYKSAVKKGYIKDGHFAKCYFCGSEDLRPDNNGEVYHDDICGTPTLVEHGVVCAHCHMPQGYVSYGEIQDITYVKTSTRRKSK